MAAAQAATWTSFAADRLAGLFPRHAGRERYKVTDRIEARVLAWTTKKKPADGSTHWSSRKLAAELGGAISHMTVVRIWAKHDLKPQRLQGYLASNDPDFESKTAEVIGLYLNPPQHAAVFRVTVRAQLTLRDLDIQGTRASWPFTAIPACRAEVRASAVAPPLLPPERRGQRPRPRSPS